MGKIEIELTKDELKTLIVCVLFEMDEYEMKVKRECSDEYTKIDKERELKHLSKVRAVYSKLKKEISK